MRNGIQAGQISDQNTMTNDYGRGALFNQNVRTPPPTFMDMPVLRRSHAVIYKSTIN